MKSPSARMGNAGAYNDTELGTGSSFGSAGRSLKPVLLNDIFKLQAQFWKIRRSRKITNLQADIFYFLMWECNCRGWENPFQIGNQLICAAIGITEKSLIINRNSLKQLGLIDFDPGITKKKAPTYYLLNSSIERNNGSNNISSIPTNNSKNIYIKEKETKTNTCNESVAPEITSWDTVGLPMLSLPVELTQSIIEKINITKGQLLSAIEIEKLWKCFKLEAVSSPASYPTIQKVYSHFSNWCCVQRFDKKPEASAGSITPTFNLKKI
jgi:hypothetical protein